MSDFPEPRLVPLAFERLDEERMLARARAFHERANRRRSVRFFSDEPVPLEVVRTAIRSAGTAPARLKRSSAASRRLSSFLFLADCYSRVLWCVLEGVSSPCEWRLNKDRTLLSRSVWLKAGWTEATEQYRA